MAREFAKSFYDSAVWKRCSKAFAASKLYICERCQNDRLPKDGKKRRFIVHHIDFLTPENINDPNITLNWDNLQLLCLDCHNEITLSHEADRIPIFDKDGNMIGLKDLTPPTGD